MKDPVETRTPIRKAISAFRNAKVRAAATGQRMVVGTTPLPIGERRNGILAALKEARTSSSARDQARPLPTPGAVGFSGISFG
jgi:hypothetical protein